MFHASSLAEQKERLQAARDDPESLRLVVDLHWAESASGKELSSLVKQLCYVYGRARASLAPPRLALTSYQGRAAAALKRFVRSAKAGGQEGLLVSALISVFFSHVAFLTTRKPSQATTASLFGTRAPGHPLVRQSIITTTGGVQLLANMHQQPLWCWGASDTFGARQQ